MVLYGTGFRNIIPKRYPPRKRKFQSILVYKKMRKLCCSI
jgi:hypothetical protein